MNKFKELPFKNLPAMSNLQIISYFEERGELFTEEEYKEFAHARYLLRYKRVVKLSTGETLSQNAKLYFTYINRNNIPFLEAILKHENSDYDTYDTPGWIDKVPQPTMAYWEYLGASEQQLAQLSKSIKKNKDNEN